MTLAQITAILGLLIAFNVPQNEINNVQAIISSPSVPIENQIQNTSEPITQTSAPQDVPIVIPYSYADVPDCIAEPSLVATTTNQTEGIVFTYSTDCSNSIQPPHIASTTPISLIFYQGVVGSPYPLWVHTSIYNGTLSGLWNSTIGSVNYLGNGYTINGGFYVGNPGQNNYYILVVGNNSIKLTQ